MVRPSMFLGIFVAAVFFYLPSGASAEKTIGVIMTGDIPYYHSIHRAFLDGIPKGEYKIVLQTPAPEPMPWANAARKLVAIGSDIIVAYGSSATLTAMKETSNIPIIYAGVFDPQGMNITGKNATGISSEVSYAVLLGHLSEISKFSKLGVVFNKSEKDTILQVREIKDLEGKIGFLSVLFDAGQKGFASQIGGVDALLLTTSSAAMAGIDSVMGAAREKKLASASAIGGGERSGVIVTMTADPGEQGREVARMVAKIAQGARPSDIPPVKPKSIDMTVNAKEAENLGFTVPSGLHGKATRVIR